MAILISTSLPINGNNPVSVSGSGIGIKYFGNAASTSSSGVPSSLLPQNNGYIAPPGNNAANGQILSVRAGGDFTIGSGFTSSPNVTIGLYPATFTGNTPTGTPTVGATPFISGTFVGSANLGGVYPWSLRCDIMASNESGLAQSVSGYVAMDGTAGSFSSAVALTGVNMNTLLPFALVVGVTFSVSDANAEANMFQFALRS
jgi:hypothetical protein